MKEDAQLICPISYHDPSGIVWSKVQQRIQERLPLRDVSWKGTGSTSISQGTVHRLPLRFMPSTASLFKDTDHPFRWFLAPYGNIYFVNVDTLEAYKDAKPAIKKWVETVLGLKRASWLLVYFPISASDKSVDVGICGKIFAKLCSDFYVERAGDRSVNLINVATAASSALPDDSLSASAAYDELFNKVKEGIMASFAQRSSLYDSDIRRLDSFRGSVQFDFRQLFLVKESLALMYQLMQLPQEALRQYGELEALLGMVPEGTLLSNDWPLAVSDDLREAARSTMSTPTLTPDSQPLLTDVSCDSVVTVLTEFEELWHDPLQEGENVLLYSINSVRMRILKNKIGTRELRRYVFSRQMHFLAQQMKCREFASKGSQYVADTYNSLLAQLSEQIPIDVKRNQQADLWALSAAVKIASTCRAHLRTQFDHLASVAALSPGKSSGKGSLLLPESKIVAIGGAGAGTGAGPIGGPSEAMETVLRKKIAQSRELQLLKDSALPLTELLNLAAKALHSFCTAPGFHSFPFLRTISHGLLSSDRADTHKLNPQNEASTSNPNRRKSHPYREYALSLSVSMGRSASQSDTIQRNRMSTKEQDPSKEDCGTAGNEFGQESELQLRMSALKLLHPGGRSLEVTGGSISTVVEEAVRAESEKALIMFSSSLRIILSREEDDKDGLGSFLGPELAQGQGQGQGLTPWCPLFVLLLRSLAHHEELGGRYRTASRSRLACADVLLCHGYYALASDSYFEAIHNGGGTEEGMVVSLMGSGHSCGTFWAELRRSVLLKILYCASALRCKVTCIKAALLLHASICIPSAPDFYTNDLSILSAMDKVDQVGIGASRDHEGAIHAFLPYFEIETQSIAVREEPSKLILLPGDSSGEIDDGVRGRVEVSSEGHYSICLNILSRFPCIIELDEVCVVFEATPTPVWNDCLIGSMDSEDIMRLGSPRCFTAALTMGSDEAITLHPAVSQALSLPFSAPSYCPSYDNYSVVQVKAVIKGRKAEQAGFGFEGTGLFGMETISFVHKKTQPLADSNSSKESSQLSPRTSVSTSSPEVQLREKSIATMCFLPFVPVICVRHISPSCREISSALGAVESEHTLGDGPIGNPLVKVDLAYRRDFEKHPDTDKVKAVACPIEALISAPLITPSRIAPLLTNCSASGLSPLNEHTLDFLAKIHLDNISLKAVRIERVVLCCSDFELSDVLNDLSCVCAATTHCKVGLTRTWTSVVLFPGESYSAILHCNFFSKILATDIAPMSNLVGVECSKEEGGETVSRTGDRKTPYLLFDCYEEDDIVLPLMSSTNNGSGQPNSSFSNLVVCLQSTCRSITRDLWHAAFTSPAETKDSDTPLNLSREIFSANYLELTHESKQGQGGTAGAQNSKGQNNRILQVSRAETETSHIQRQRVLTKAVKTDRLIFFSPSSW